MTEAFSNRARSSFKYEFSVPVAVHGEDIVGYFGPSGGSMSPDFMKAFMSKNPSFKSTDLLSIYQPIVQKK